MFFVVIHFLLYFISCVELYDCIGVCNIYIFSNIYIFLCKYVTMIFYASIKKMLQIIIN